MTDLCLSVCVCPILKSSPRGLLVFDITKYRCKLQCRNFIERITSVEVYIQLCLNNIDFSEDTVTP